MTATPRNLCSLLILLLMPGAGSCAVAGDGLNRDDSLHDRYVAGQYDRTLAEFQQSDAMTPPVNGPWTAVKLPHLWPREVPGVLSGWYRFELPDEPYEVQSAVYLWRFSMNAAVWLNDQFLGDGGRFTEPMARNWNRPMLFLLPASAWQPEDNFLYVKLAVYPGWGHLPPIVIGPYEKLRPDYDKRFRWQISFSEATWFISLITALVALTFWSIDRGSSIYGIFGLTCLAWSLYSLNNFIQEIPVSAKTWWWAVHSSVDWYGILLALFGHRLMNVRARLLERVFLAFGILATLFYAVVELSTLSRYNSLIHLVTMAIVVYVVCQCAYRLWRSPDIETGAFAFCMGVIMAFGIHDLSMNAMVTVSLWQNQFFWLHFSAPILMITMLVMLSRRYVLALRTRLVAEQQIRSERERIFADVHDDVGSKVLSLVYAAESETQANMAREALRDIRSIVSGATLEGGRFLDLLDEWHAEVQERCELAEFTLQWQVIGEQEAVVSDSFHYHLKRIFRELVTNALKHAAARQLEIVIRLEPALLRVSVRDFGNGTRTPARLEPGSGMSSVQRRVTDLGGEVTWRDAAPGCRVSLSIPWEKL
ncbi:MAG: ATP-binding protein [Pseudomonadota bacterium]